ncbi:MAG TPA: NfeD family protein [Polyangiales bacterium]|nr:NfeD family protein [Polyangiales bacterium]
MSRWAIISTLALLSASFVALAQDAGVEASPKAQGYTPRASKAGAKRDLDWSKQRAAGVVVIPIQGTIDLGLAALVKRTLAHYPKAGVFLLDINTLGGRVDAAIEIRDSLLESPIPTIAFVHPRAISAGALISFACDAIVIARGGTIGAATPIQLEEGKAEAVSEKMTSYFRTEMRATAEANGRRGDVAEAMVDASVVIEGYDPADKLLTLDTEGALGIGIADVQADDIEAVLAALNLTGSARELTSENWAEKLVRFITDPVVSGLLMSLGSLGILVELYAPGHLLSGAVGVICLLLFFGGHLIVNLVGLEELILLAAGAGLIALEVFVIPGFGVIGIAGILCVMAALVLSTIGLPLKVVVATGAWVEPLTRVAIALALTMVGMIIAARYLPRTRLFSGLILKSALTSNTSHDGPRSFVSADESKYVGQSGVAESDLRPVGVARFGEQRIDVVSEGGYVRAGSRVRVIAVEGARIVVRAEAEDLG